MSILDTGLAWKARAEYLQRCFDSALDDFMELEEQKIKAEATVETVERDLETLRDERATMDRKNVELRNLIEEERERSALVGASLDRRREWLEKRNEWLGTELEERNQVIKGLEWRLGKLEDEIEEIQGSLNDRIEHLTDALDARIAELDQLDRRRVWTEKRNEWLNAQLEIVRRQLRAAQDEIALCLTHHRVDLKITSRPL